MNYILSKFSGSVTTKINSIRKVSKEIKPELITIIVTYLDAINSLGEFDESLDGLSIDKIKIPSKLSIFIQPKTVRIDTADRGDIDFRERPACPETIPSYSKFIEACDVVASAMKTSISNYQTVEEIRKNVGLVSVYKQSVNKDGLVVYDGANPYIPVMINFDGVEEYTRKYSLDELIEDFIQWKLPELFK